ncbi:regulatory protein RecX [Bacteroides sedimenti]|uniref:Regulatory protein RecX n=1 Tax=Bacteroides sedimenti TaxID=2136147 RepID=A0ABN6ZCL3_9BACE
MNELTEKEALNKAAAYCTASERCCSEVTSKLVQWGVDVKTQEKILKRLLDERFIDEERYCRFFVNDKFRFNKWGRMKISQALYMKKIPSSVFSRYLEEIEERDYMNVLRSLLSSKRKSIRDNDDYQLNMKLIRFALSRGFEMNIIRKCLQLSDEYDLLD